MISHPNIPKSKDYLPSVNKEKLHRYLKQGVENVEQLPPIKEGELILIAGTTGAGKSTLSNLLVGKEILKGRKHGQNFGMVQTRVATFLLKYG